MCKGLLYSQFLDKGIGKEKDGIQTSVAKACEAESGWLEVGGRRLRPYWPMNEPSSFIPAARNHAYKQATRHNIHAKRIAKITCNQIVLK